MIVLSGIPARSTIQLINNIMSDRVLIFKKKEKTFYGLLEGNYYGLNNVEVQIDEAVHTYLPVIEKYNKYDTDEDKGAFDTFIAKLAGEYIFNIAYNNNKPDVDIQKLIYSCEATARLSYNFLIYKILEKNDDVVMEELYAMIRRMAFNIFTDKIGLMSYENFINIAENYNVFKDMPVSAWEDLLKEDDNAANLTKLRKKVAKALPDVDQKALINYNLYELTKLDRVEILDDEHDYVKYVNTVLTDVDTPSEDGNDIYGDKIITIMMPAGENENIITRNGQIIDESEIDASNDAQVEAVSKKNVFSSFIEDNPEYAARYDYKIDMFVGIIEKFSTDENVKEKAEKFVEEFLDFAHNNNKVTDAIVSRELDSYYGFMFIMYKFMEQNGDKTDNVLTVLKDYYTQLFNEDDRVILSYDSVINGAEDFDDMFELPVDLRFELM